MSRLSYYIFLALSFFVGMSLETIAFGAVKLEVSASPAGRLFFQFKGDGFLNDKCRKDLKSGISTQVIFLSRIVALPSTVASEQVMTFESRYDLWNENFSLNTNGDKKIIARQAEIETWFEGQAGVEIGSLEKLKKDVQYRIDVVQTLNPLNEERLKSVQEWLIQQKLSSRGTSTNDDMAAAVETSRSAVSGLIYNLWERAAAGELLTGELRREAHSEIFSLESLTAKPGAKK